MKKPFWILDFIWDDTAGGARESLRTRITREFCVSPLSPPPPLSLFLFLSGEEKLLSF